MRNETDDQLDEPLDELLPEPRPEAAAAPEIPAASLVEDARPPSSAARADPEPDDTAGPGSDLPDPTAAPSSGPEKAGAAADPKEVTPLTDPDPMSVPAAGDGARPRPPAEQAKPLPDETAQAGPARSDVAHTGALPWDARQTVVIRATGAPASLPPVAAATRTALASWGLDLGSADRTVARKGSLVANGTTIAAPAGRTIETTVSQTGKPVEPDPQAMSTGDGEEDVADQPSSRPKQAAQLPTTAATPQVAVMESAARQPVPTVTATLDQMAGRIVEETRAAAETARAQRPAPAGQPMTLRIQLNPAELGIVTAEMRIHGNRIEVEIRAETDHARARLATDREAIVRSLGASGYEVDRVTIQYGVQSASSASQAGFQGTLGDDGAARQQAQSMADDAGRRDGGTQGGRNPDDQDGNTGATAGRDRDARAAGGSGAIYI